MQEKTRNSAVLSVRAVTAASAYKWFPRATICIVTWVCPPFHLLVRLYFYQAHFRNNLWFGVLPQSVHTLVFYYKVFTLWCFTTSVHTLVFYYKCSHFGVLLQCSHFGVLLQSVHTLVFYYKVFTLWCFTTSVHTLVFYYKVFTLWCFTTKCSHFGVLLQSVHTL